MTADEKFDLLKEMMDELADAIFALAYLEIEPAFAIIDEANRQKAISKIEQVAKANERYIELSKKLRSTGTQQS